jgi:hypothetical protein
MVATMKTATKIRTQQQLKALTPISCLHPDALATDTGNGVLIKTCLMELR